MKSLTERIVEKLRKDLFAYAGYSYPEGPRPAYGDETVEGRFTTVDLKYVRRGGSAAKFVVGRPRVVYSKSILKQTFSEEALVNKIVKKLTELSEKRG